MSLNTDRSLKKTSIMSKIFGSKKKSENTSRTVILEKNEVFGVGCTFISGPNGKGIVIDSIQLGGPADSSDLHKGDCILKINNIDCKDTSYGDFMKMVADGISKGPVVLEVTSSLDDDFLRSSMASINVGSTTGSSVALSPPTARAGSTSPMPSSFTSPDQVVPATAAPLGSTSNSYSSISPLQFAAPPRQLSSGSGLVDPDDDRYVTITNAAPKQEVLDQIRLEQERKKLEEERRKLEEERRRFEEAAASTRPSEISFISSASAPSPAATNSPINNTNTNYNNTSSISINSNNSGSTFSATSSADSNGNLVANYLTPDDINLPGRAPVPEPRLARQVVQREPLYFVGPANGEMAAAILQSKEDGSYLLRESLSRPNEYAISVKFNTIHHVAVTHDAEGYRIGRSHVFPTVAALIKHYQENSLQVHFSPLKTALLHPCGSQEFK